MSAWGSVVHGSHRPVSLDGQDAGVDPDQPVVGAVWPVRSCGLACRSITDFPMTRYNEKNRVLHGFSKLNYCFFKFYMPTSFCTMDNMFWGCSYGSMTEAFLQTASIPQAERRCIRSEACLERRCSSRWPREAAFSAGSHDRICAGGGAVAEKTL